MIEKRLPTPEDGLPSGFSEMENSLQFLEAIKQASLQVSSSLNQQNILFYILKSCFELIQGLRDARVFLLEGDKITCSAEISRKGNLQLTPPDANLFGWVGQLFDSAGTYTRQSLQAQSKTGELPQSWTGSIISRPFNIQELSKGVMVLALDRERALSRNEEFIINLLKDQAAISLHNALIHRAVEQQALSDTLTGLPNRRSLDYRLQEHLAQADRDQHGFALLLLDINQFKQLNDRYGHPGGDVLLYQTAQFLRQVLRKTDFIARYGGDEFAIIIPDSNPSSAMKTAVRIQKLLDKHLFKIDPGVVLHLSVCIGIAAFPENGSTPQELLAFADRDLYQKKSKTA